MSQRNFQNDRYNEENRTGKTRKSASSAKPKAQRAATVREPAPKTKKQKKAERRERERKAEEKANNIVQGAGRFEDTEGYKRLRRIWWVCLIGAVVVTALTFFLSSARTKFFEEGEGADGALWLGFLDEPTMATLGTVMLVLAYGLIILAFYIDLGRIRKERRIFQASLLNDKSKAARKEQKRLKAEQRAQEKEAAEKGDEESDEAEKAGGAGGIFGRLFKGKQDNASDEGDSAESQDTEEKEK